MSLDTSGSVTISAKSYAPDNQVVWVDRHIAWSDLDPFTQGYVEALLSGSIMVRRENRDLVPERFGFAGLAPETLAAILKDCEHFGAADAWQRRAAAGLPGDLRKAGAEFWYMRQRGAWAYFRPLAPHLGDDGKIYLRPLKTGD